jgi:DNA-binding PucR family transcriptional regulator
MGVTVADVLGLETLQQARLLTDADLFLTIVRGVAVIEVPVESFVRVGDLVLSTGMGIGHDNALLAQFVVDVAAAGAAALVIGVGEYVATVPQAMIVAANEHKLPLFTIPWEVRFSTIIEAILRLLLQAQATRNRRGDVVWSLARGTYLSGEQARMAAQHVGYDLSRHYTAVVGQIHEPSRAGQAADESAEHIVTVAEDVARRRHQHLLAAWQGATVLLFCETGEDNTDTEVIAQLLDTLHTRVPNAAVTWGMGRSQVNGASFQRSYAEAELACQIGLRVWGIGSVTDIRRIGSVRVLLQIARTEESHALWQDYLGPLLTYDRQRTGKLLATLAAYLEQEGNRSAIARQLHIRRQSLEYRLRQIEQLTRRSLRDADDRFAFALSMELYKLQREGDASFTTSQ